MSQDKEKLIKKLEEYFDEEVAEGMVDFFKHAADYGMGDDFAGFVLKGTTDETYKKIEDLFEEKGLEASFSTYSRVGAMNFVKNPDTGDEDLDEDIKSLI